MKKILKINNLSTIIVEFILSILFYISLEKLIYIKNYIGSLSPIYLLLTLLLGFLIIFLIGYRLRLYKKIEEIFLTIMTVIGLGYLFLIIPGHVADENAHFYSAYNISNGDILDINPTGMIPSEFSEYGVNQVSNYQALNERLITKTNYKETTEITPSGYISLLYMPASFGLFIGRVLNINLYTSFYIARTMMFITFLIAAFYSLKIIPYGKKILLVYMFNPMFIHQAMSLSADNLINILSILFTGIILKIIHDKTTEKEIDNKYFKLLVFLAIFIALSKYIYLPIILLLLLLLGKYTDKKQRKKIIILGIVATTLCGLSFVYTSIFRNAAPNPYIIENNVSTFTQLKYLLKNPIMIFNVLYNTIIYSGGEYILQFFGVSLGWLNIPINYLIMFIYIFILMWVSASSSSKIVPTKNEKRLLIGIPILVFILGVFAMYLGWTPVGYFRTLGVQGRYYIPVVFMILIALIKKSNNMNEKDTTGRLALILGTLNIFVLVTIAQYFI